MLGAMLFLIFIFDFDDDLSSKVLKFAEDRKEFIRAKTAANKGTLQDDLTKLVKWSEKWQMLFYVIIVLVVFVIILFSIVLYLIKSTCD